MKFGNFRWALIVVMMALVALARPAVGAQKEDAEKRASEAYKKAYQLLLDREYEKAREQFAQFVKDYSKTRWYDDARYWYCYALENSTTSMEKAFESYYELVREFDRTREHAQSEWRDEAAERAVLLAKKLAKTNPKYRAYIEELSQSQEDEITASVVMALLESGEVETILEILDTTDNPEVRRLAVYALQDCDSPKCNEKLVEIARGDRDPEMRRYAVYALADRGEDADVVRLLTSLLESETDPEIRRLAVFTIAESEDPAVASTLIDIALNDKDPETARAAAFGLSEVDDPAVTPALERLVKEARDPEVKKAALYALVERGDVTVLPTLERIAMAGESQELSQAATWAIAEMKGDPAAATALAKIFKSSKDIEVRKAALYGLAETDGKVSVELMKEAALTADNEELARAALFALSNAVDDEQAAPLILEVYRKTPFTDVRTAALHVLLETEGEAALPVISTVLESEPDPDLRVAAVMALDGTTDEDAAVKILARVAKNDPSSKVRRVAVQVLGQIRTEAAREALLEILKDRSAEKKGDRE